LDRAVAQMESYLTEGISKAMSQFNGAVLPPVKKEQK
jgi:hypothetical protein